MAYDATNQVIVMFAGRGTGGALADTWVWNGKELKPKQGASYSNTWVVDGSRVKPKQGANSGNTYDCGKESILVIAGKVALKVY